jgi:hypothetical protein
MRSVFKSQNRVGVDFGWRRDKEVDVDFNILTALKGWVGLAPSGAGCPPYYYYLTLIQYFKVKVKVKKRTIS